MNFDTFVQKHIDVENMSFQEEAQSDKPSQCGASSALSQSMALPPQRSRASSDVGCAPKNGASHAVPLNGISGYQQSKPAGGWAEKENGGQVFGIHGISGAVGMNGDAHCPSGEYLPSDFGATRRTVDEYLQSRPSLQLPTVYRNANTAPVGDSIKFKEPAANGSIAISQQINALKLSAAKEVLSPAAGAAAGSHILSMIGQGSSQTANTSSAEWKNEKPPLFARAGGGRESNTGSLYRTAPCASAAVDEVSAQGWCRQCGLCKYGDIDTSDGNFYCDDCWKAFELSRNSNTLSMVRRCYFTAVVI